MKSALKFGQKSAFKTKTYNTPSKQKESTGSTHESVHGQDDSKRESKRDSNRGNKLKEWLMTNKGFNQVDADKMIKEGAYTYKDMLKDMGVNKDVDGDVSPTKQEGPIPKKNVKLQPGEMEGTYLFGHNYGDEDIEGAGEGFEPTGTKDQKFTANERIIDMEERAGFLTDNDIPDLEGSTDPKDIKRLKTLKATVKKLQHEADIMRKRRENERKSSPTKQTKSGRGNIFTKKGRVQRKINKGKIPAPLKPISNPGIKNVPERMVSITKVPQKYVAHKETLFPDISKPIKKKKRFL